MGEVNVRLAPEKQNRLLQDRDHKIEGVLQGGPKRSKQSNLAAFTVEGGLDAKFLYFAIKIAYCLSNIAMQIGYLPHLKNKSQTPLRHTTFIFRYI